jgi:nitrogen fixation protein FixH
MKLGWGWRIALLYGGFVGLIMVLVVASSRQHFDLVSKNYYDAELGYQKVIDAGKNQSELSAPINVHANSGEVALDLPAEFSGKQVTGDVEFYSPVNAAWDRTFKLNAQNNIVSISRSTLQQTKYVVKINCIVDGKNYYQESEILLHP